MASAASASALWGSVHETEPKLASEIGIDGDLMAFLDESQVDNEEDERLRCVIQSLEAEIEPSTVGREEFILPNSHESHATPEVSEEHSLSSYPIDEPFDWVDMEMVSSSMGNDMDQWYLDACMDEMGHMYHYDQLSYVDAVRDHGFYHVEAPMEIEYGPLWEEHVWH